MKKTIITACILVFLAATSAFATEVSAGLTYDSQGDSFLIGTEFSLEETFENNSNLSAELSYENNGVYSASLLYNKYLSIFVLSGGINNNINKTGIVPFITGGAGIILNDFSLLASGGLNLSHDNVFKPDTYFCSADIIFDTGESIIDLSFLYKLNNSSAGSNSKIGGGLVFTAYKEDTPAEIKILTDVLYVNNTVTNISGVAVDAGLGIHVYLPFMSIKLKTMVDAWNPERQLNSPIPFSIGLSTGFVL
ncbi:MAG: hypothetical protein KBT02_01285 [Treponema sp.]|nr:hypothetical protein [Candidatus Treponema caballi]